MKMREDFEVAAERVIRRIRTAGYAVSVHHMGEYVELHAVQGASQYRAPIQRRSLSPRAHTRRA